jgi:hypothetical protein
MHNKSMQFAPSGPDAKTAARFRRRCGQRYSAQSEIAHGSE